jgi:translation initiation factor IF-3
LAHIKDFLTKGHKVKVSLVFRGRENVHREIGFEVVNRVIKECEGVCTVDMTPRMMGRMLIAMLGGKAPKA